MRMNYVLIRYHPVDSGQIIGWVISNDLERINQRSMGQVRDKLNALGEPSVGKHDLGDGFVLLVNIED